MSSDEQQFPLLFEVIPRLGWAANPEGCLEAGFGAHVVKPIDIRRRLIALIEVTSLTSDEAQLR